MINYIARVRKNPITNAVNWYAQIANVKHLSLEDIAEKIALNCTVTEHDIKAVISAMQEQITIALREGHSIRLGDLGSFRPTIKSYPAPTREKLTAEHIKRICVRFTPSSRLRQSLMPGQRNVRLARVENEEEEEATN